MIYTLDHGPAHVHLVGPEGRAKVALQCPDGPVVPIDSRGIDAYVLTRLLAILNDELPMLCKAWSTVHGNH